MRRPTGKEKHVLLRCLDGLEKDIALVVSTRPPVRGIHLVKDVHGTMRVNLETMLSILTKLETED